MVAMAQFIPEDPREKDAVEAVLSAHPELESFIADVSEIANRSFTDVQFVMDARRYEEDDPLLTFRVEVAQPWEDYQQVVNQFIRTVGTRSDYDRDLILVMPTWVRQHRTVTQPQ